MVLSRCSMTDITAKLFCSQVRKRCTKHSTWHLPSSCECVTTALICQLLPRLPKNSDICSLWCCSRYFIARSMIIRHISSSSWVRAFCFAYSWLTERSKCAFQAWTAGEHSLCSKFILALVSSLMTKSSIFFSMSQKFESRESHLSQWMSGSLKAFKVQWSLLCSFLPSCVYSPSLNIFLLLSSVVALFQPNTPLPRFPLKCRRLRADCQMLQSLPLWCYQAHEGTSVSMLSKCRAF